MLFFKIKTYYEPKELLKFLKLIEQQSEGKSQQNGVRGNRPGYFILQWFNLLDSEITIPHKDLLNRDFVLVPLNEIAPGLIHPEVNKKISELLF